MLGLHREMMITLRGQQVILSNHVAELYGVETREVNQAIKNNPDKFPDGYVIELNKNEKSEVVKIFDNLGNLLYSPTNPKAFTEKHPYNNLNAILAQASASASAWWWFVIGQPQASATVCNW